MNQKIKEILEAIMEEVGAIGGSIDTSTGVMGALPNDVVGRPKPFTKQVDKRERKGQLGYPYKKTRSKFIKMQDKKGKVQ